MNVTLVSTIVLIWVVNVLIITNLTNVNVNLGTEEMVDHVMTPTNVLKELMIVLFLQIASTAKEVSTANVEVDTAVME